MLSPAMTVVSVLKRSNRTILAGAAAVAIGLALLTPLALADFDSGLKAYEAKDYRTAFQEWSAAANSGDANAQFHLGQLYERGQGVVQNYVQAHRWYNIAAAAGIEAAAKARDDLARKMSQEELADARELASRWKPTEQEATTPRGNAQSSAPAMPAEAVTHFHAGFDALKARKYDAAIKEFRAGIAIKDDAQAEFYLGEAYRLKGEKTSARAAYRRSLGIDPHSAVSGNALSAEKSLIVSRKERTAALPLNVSVSSDFVRKLSSGAWVLSRVTRDADANSHLGALDDGSTLAKTLRKACEDAFVFELKDGLVYEKNLMDRSDKKPNRGLRIISFNGSTLKYGASWFTSELFFSSEPRAEELGFPREILVEKRHFAFKGTVPDTDQQTYVNCRGVQHRP